MTTLAEKVTVSTTTTPTAPARTPGGLTPPPAAVRSALRQLRGSFPRLLDRRTLPRFSYTAAAALATPDARVRSVWTHDINASTVGFVSQTSIEPGTRVTVRLDLPDGGRREVKGRVMRSRSYTHGWHEGYVNFETNLDPTTLATAYAARG